MSLRGVTLVEVPCMGTGEAFSMGIGDLPTIARNRTLLLAQGLRIEFEELSDIAAAAVLLSLARSIAHHSSSWRSGFNPLCNKRIQLPWEFVEWAVESSGRRRLPLCSLFPRFFLTMTQKSFFSVLLLLLL